MKQLRKEKGLTFNELSNELLKANIKISPDALAKYEREDRNPKIDKWEALANFWEVSVPYLQGYVDEYIDIHDLNEEEEDAYNRITDMLCEEYPEDSISWSKIGQLLINADTEEF